MRKILFALLLASCSHHLSTSSDQMTSIQILDRNGFSETISLKDRLTVYEKTDFTSPQPYQKIVRVYGKTNLGKTASKITTYHPNGYLFQYLEVVDGRAHGAYREWYLSGKLKISAVVIEGTPDVSELSQMTWLFEGLCRVFDEEGTVIAALPYTKGLLEGESCYYFSSGELMKKASYHKNELHGSVLIFNEKGTCLESALYHEGVRDGLSSSYWSQDELKSEEFYQKGLLINAKYLNPQGEIVAQIQNGFGKQALFQENFVASLLDYQQGKVEGEVQTYNKEGHLITLYTLKDGMKTGEEWEYYPSKNHSPKLYLQWDQDTIQGVSKTWYENGVLESQREMQNSKKQGASFAWFKDGDLMLMEEYEDDALIKGSYFKKSEKTAISKVENGKGIATLFDKDGRFLRKISYERGSPVTD